MIRWIVGVGSGALLTVAGLVIIVGNLGWVDPSQVIGGVGRT